MPEPGRAVDRVGVPTTDFGDRHDAGLLEVGDDPVDAPLGDADLGRHVAKSGVGVVRQAHEDMGVVAQEGPRGGDDHGVMVTDGDNPFVKWGSPFSVCC